MARLFLDMDGTPIAKGDIVFTHTSVYEVIDFVLDHPKAKFAKGAVKVRIFPRTPHARPKLVTANQTRKIDSKQYTIAKLMRSYDTSTPVDCLGQRIQKGDTVIFRSVKYTVSNIHSGISVNNGHRVSISSYRGDKCGTAWSKHTFKIT